ncbi:MAG: rhodanese-like domain-containing protein [Burkholderiales bacterium]
MQHLTPKQTYDFLQTHPEAVLIDVRSEMEFLFVGHPVGAILVPWYNTPDWDLNPHFVGEVKMAASLNRPVVLICRSGNRSVEAGHALESAGMPEVYNVLYGFEGELDEHHHRGTLNGWRNDGLPWEQC